MMVMMMMIARKKLQTNRQLCPPCRSPSTRPGSSSFTSTSSLVRRGANCDKNSELKKLHRCPVFTYIPLQVEIGLSVSPSWLQHKESGWGVAGQVCLREVDLARVGERPLFMCRSPNGSLLPTMIRPCHHAHAHHDAHVPSPSFLPQPSVTLLQRHSTLPRLVEIQHIHLQCKFCMQRFCFFATPHEDTRHRSV